MIKQICIIFLITSIPIAALGNFLPFVKIYEAAGPSFLIPGYTINISSEELQNEKSVLEESFKKIGIQKHADGIAINLILADVDLPIEDRKYKDQIYQQGYHLKISSDKIEIESPSAAGIYYGIQTFLKCCTSDSLYEADIKDWPDFPVRMIMVDPARQNENKSYYKRLIRFCGEYKINRIQVHLTDDQTSALFAENYPELMHPHAWKKEDISELINLASRHHIKLVPEIESFGHSRMFSRLEDAKDYLHQTDMWNSDSPWSIVDMPGYTSMLCPASDKAIRYLNEMYQKATLFESDCIHIGFDEVDLTDCERCNEKFGKLTGPQLFRTHMNHCIRMAGQHFTRIGVWGDMILKHPEILDSIPSDKVIIYDWHYWPDVTAESVDFFQEKGFEVIACPALVSWPHIMFPDHNAYTNISRFTRIAYEKELLGVNTTIWAPMRYMTDILWTGIAYAAVHSWAESNWDETGFYKEFAREFFGSQQGDAFMNAWNELCNISIHLDVFFTGSWLDMEGLNEARLLASERSEEFKDIVNRLQKIQEELSVFGNSVTRHYIEWNVLEQTTAMRSYIVQHLLASNKLMTDQGYNTELLKQLDESCILISDWIEDDWDRNRYADDPNKNGIYVPTDHLLYRFKQMHEFHLLCSSLQGQSDPESVKRGLADTVGFAHLDWQMDSVMARIQALNHDDLIRSQQAEGTVWRTAICPHDDYTYAGWLYPAVLSNIEASTVIIFGVAHKASSFKLENQLVFDSFTSWHGPYGAVKVSSLRDELISQLPGDMAIVHDSMATVEHSVEALIPFLQYQDRNKEIISILVPYMDFKRMQTISQVLAEALFTIMKQKNLHWGEDIALLISSDAVHYGDEDWGGKNYAPYGTDSSGNAKAVSHEKEIIRTCFEGELTGEKIARFFAYTVNPDNYKEYKWTWCGRYSIPFGLLTSQYLHTLLESSPLTGILVAYATSISQPHLKVVDLRMGQTAIATPRHWVGYPAIGFK